MTTPTHSPSLPPADVVYPDSDGRPMADNTLQFEWIVTIKEGLEAVFRDRPDVFVAGDLLWYPVEGRPTIRAAPDAMVAIGRPKGHRGSYRQWEEGGIPPQVVFEVLSPGNRPPEMIRKFRFHERYGVQEYYVYDPDRGELRGWQRQGSELRELPTVDGWVSPRLGVRFELSGGTLRLYGPDGRPFATYVELARRRDEAERQAEAAHLFAEAERQRAEAEQQRAEAERQRADRLAERLRALGIDPDSP